MNRLPAALLSLLAIVLLGTAAPARADGPVRVSADALPEAIASAAPGDTIEVTGGVYHGNLVIDKPLALIGIDNPVLDGDGFGTVLLITAPDTTLRGFTVRNSGNLLDQENAGIIAAGPRAVLEDNTLHDVLFGVYVRDADGVLVRNNVIDGQDLDIARRGDLIRVWDADDVTLENNTVTDGRDVVLWYSERLTLRGNTFTRGRYGLHFMYCDDAVIEGNRLTNNSVGAYLMYGRAMHLRDNLISANRGPSGYGIGLKDMDDSVITGNLVLDNRVGAFIDGSPREIDSTSLFRGNVFAYNDVAVEMLPSVRRNLFVDNSFVENEQQVTVSGGGVLVDDRWNEDGRGNYWSDYAGYDGDGDGVGDIAYRADRLFESLSGAYPALRLFLYSPVTTAIDFAAKAFPVARPQPILTDEAPLVDVTVAAAAPDPQSTAPSGALGFALPAAVLALGLGLFALAFPARRRYRLPRPNGQSVHSTPARTQS